MTRVGILGVGAVGARLARQLVSTDVDEVVIRDDSVSRAELVATSLGDAATVDRGAMTDPLDADIVVLAGPGRVQAGQAAVFVRAGQHVVSHQRRHRRRAGAALPRPRGPRAGRAPGGGRRLRPGPDLRAGRPRRHPLRPGRRDPRGQVGHRRSRLRPPAPPGRRSGCASTGARAAGSSAPGARAASCAGSPTPSAPQDCYRAALPDALRPRAGLPGHRAGHRPRVGHPPRPPHRPAPDAVADPPRGRARRRPGRGAGPPGVVPRRRGARRDGPSGRRRRCRGRGGGAVGGRAALCAGRVRPGWPSWSTRWRSSPSWPAGA